ncbi:N-6 DNA methylase [Nocardia higoensis]|uniref:site-specific DNA-methyltransferase (adenine-specific) n=1 Tax=Nocardia higoensis TaxID=228599 RepID=A0ABS0DII1_9NOCA|nr:N-6 DNA methylase [Nocardia higoensis]MBF6358257.1 N-6 DNA methylase [Nocardia higoensis]
MSPSLETIVGRLASRSPVRPEATTQADIYMLLTTAALGLDTDDVVTMESPVADGTRRRIDIEAGHVVIEVKKDLRAADLADAEKQLAGYVAQRTKELGGRYVGILTDGTVWRLYHLAHDQLACVSELELSPREPDHDALLVWLESVMATREKIRPVPAEIEQRLGADSPAHQLDYATLEVLYHDNRNHPEVKLKRELWAKLLRTASGTGFVDDEALFINHTLLVVTAELVAHAAIGWDVSPHGPLSPTQLTSGTEFANAQIYGVVEADFFDWVVEVAGGEQFVTELGRRIARFDWSRVEHDVLKVLYQSVITTPERERLGEYYTPDWLADRVVAECVTDPLSTRLADPSCGSGTFIFHAVRRYLDAAEDVGTPTGQAVLEVTRHVVGMDVHPVAVTLARVTYLLAIGIDRINSADRGPLTVPIYLGDSVQWEQSRDLFGGADRVTITTAGHELVEGGGVLFGDDLVFPRSILGDAGRFDQLVSAMADAALDLSPKKLDRTLADPILRRFAVTDEEAAILRTTFSTMRALHRSGRNHIWGYYVRNLIRPLWLSEPGNRVDILVGNPPWLRYSKMTEPMQKRYKLLAKPRNLLSTGLGASARDLSTLFVVRAVEMYLRKGGQFAFVMPHGTLTRKPHAGFRSGVWATGTGDHLTVAFGTSWDLAETTTGFPMVSCVVHGHRAVAATAVPSQTVKWSGRLRRADLPWSEAAPRITRAPGTLVAPSDGDGPPPSPYKSVFRNGAILYPRLLLFVQKADAGPLGAGAGRVAVTSFRSTQEKEPWKYLPALSGRVERRFVRSVYLGETVLPHRCITPRLAVLPLESTSILKAQQVAEHPGLSGWWNQAESTWNSSKPSSDTSQLLDRIDFHGQLAAQLPTAALRVVYTKSGNTLASALVRDDSAIIDHKLYWAPVTTESEGHYLCAILNSATLLERVKPLQALGLFGPRDFDKNVFAVPFPKYDSTIDLHIRLAELGALAERTAADADIASARTFQAARKKVAAELISIGLAQKIEDAVAELVPLEAVLPTEE